MQYSKGPELWPSDPWVTLGSLNTGNVWHNRTVYGTVRDILATHNEDRWQALAYHIHEPLGGNRYYCHDANWCVLLECLHPDVDMYFTC